MVMFDTCASKLWSPRLPMLIPWPGPHSMLLAYKFFMPVSIDMQSSPVLILGLRIRTSYLLEIWITLVSGLLSDAVMVR